MLVLDIVAQLVEALFSKDSYEMNEQVAVLTGTEIFRTSSLYCMRSRGFLICDTLRCVSDGAAFSFDRSEA